MQSQIFSKLGVIAVLSLALLVPLFLIGAQIAGRSAHQAEVLHEIAESAAGPQTVLGPVVVVRYHELVEHTVKDENTGREVIRQQVLEGAVVTPPEDLDIRGEARVETRSRGIYRARLFHSALQVSGDLMVYPGIGVDSRKKILDAEAYLVMGVTDPRGISNDPIVTINGTDKHFATGTVGLGNHTGVHLSLGPVELSKGGRFAFSYPLTLMGTERLAFTPTGNRTTIALKSDWADPSFQGRFLPTTRTVSANGFEARWEVSALARNFDQILQGGPAGLDSEILGIGFLEPVNVYLMSQRAITYGILFVVLTFAAFFLTEILRRLRIHPLQYVLVGLALAIFFLVLIALSEHIAFGIAYAISAGACVALIGTYLSGVLGERKLAAQFAAGIALLYAVLYGVLLSEDNALLMGTALLFAALGIVMLSTRHLDWYGIGKSADESNDADDMEYSGPPGSGPHSAYPGIR